MMVDQRCLAVMKYGNYDVEQDGMDNKARKEWLLYGESVLPCVELLVY